VITIVANEGRVSIKPGLLYTAFDRQRWLNCEVACKWKTPCSRWDTQLTAKCFNH